MIAGWGSEEFIYKRSHIINLKEVVNYWLAVSVVEVVEDGSELSSNEEYVLMSDINFGTVDFLSDTVVDFGEWFHNKSISSLRVF